jgi:hypothetical protein
MFVVTAIVSVLLAALMIYAAVRKLSHQEQVVANYRRAGVPEGWLNYLAIILILGASGLIAGLIWMPIGITAAIGTIAYFLGGIAFHFHAGDTKSLPTPILMVALAAAALTLRLTT